MEDETLDVYKEKVKELIKFVDTLPEPYRMTTYDTLLGLYLSSFQNPDAIMAAPGQRENDTGVKKEYKFSFDVRAFMDQYEISEEKIRDIFFLDESGISPKYNLNMKKKATYQIDIALLIALENALSTTLKLEFDMEEVRKRCIENKCYDLSHFTGNFQKWKNLFKDLSNSEHIELSPAGKQQLSEVIRKLTNDVA
jgi:hypothetical protein